MNTYAYVGGNPISNIDPTGLIEATCQPEGFGSGYDEDGDKLCNYSCSCDGRTVGGIVGGAQRPGGGDICYGYLIHTRPTTDGRLSTSAGPMTPFTVDTESLLDRYFNYGSLFSGSLLIDNIEATFPQPPLRP